MKDENDTKTADFFSARPKGQPRKYANNAEKQKAYRERKKAREVAANGGATAELEGCKGEAL